MSGVQTLPEPQGLYLPANLWREMQTHLAAQAPEEACGLLAGTMDKGVYRAVQSIPVTNILHSPSRYRMAPAEQLAAFNHIEALGLELVGIYHSHPQGPPGPSPTDIAEAYYPEVLYLIWSGQDGAWSCQAYWIQAKLVRQVNILLEE